MGLLEIRTDPMCHWTPGIYFHVTPQALLLFPDSEKEYLSIHFIIKDRPLQRDHLLHVHFK